MFKKIRVSKGKYTIQTAERGIWVFVVCLNEETGNMTQRVFCVCVCVFVCVCTRMGGLLALRQASLLDGRPLPHFPR